MKKLTAKDIMTQNVLAAKADWSVSRLIEFFAENCISGSPVIEDEKLIGVVSLTDILRLDPSPEKYSTSYDTHEYYLHALENQFAPQEINSLQMKIEPLTTVRDIMTPKIFKVTENTTVQDVADTMIKSYVHRLFVTRGENVVGIISAVDMLKVIRNM